MKTHIFRILCIALAVCMLLPLAGCKDKAIYIACSNATTGTAIKDIAVSVSYGEDTLPHTATWYISQDDALFSLTGDHILRAGNYELHISYPLQSNKAVAVNANCGEGTLVGTQKVDDETRKAVIRYHFAEDPAQAVATTETHYITIRCPNAKQRTSIDHIDLELLLDDAPLEYTAQWKQVAENKQTIDLAPGSILESNTLYQLQICYEMDLMHPAKIKGPFGVHGEPIFNKRLEDGSFMIIVQFYFPE